MFYENEKEILNRMMEKVPNDIDKRKNSSLVYHSLSPTSQELSRAYSNMDRYLSYAIASPELPEEFLDLLCKPDGVFRKKSTQAIKQGIFKGKDNNLIDIPLNSRFSINKINYRAIEKIEVGKYKLECEVAGIQGNFQSGELLPIEYIENLGTAILEETINEGTDKETNENLFERWMIKIQTPSTSGNKYHYQNWALEVDGVGKAKVIPRWQGNNTVKVIITNSNSHGASQELIQKVFDYIEDVRPIGADVTVVSAVEKQINISVSISISNGYTIDSIREKFIKLSTEYLESIVFKIDYISIARIGNLLLQTDGVLDYLELKINNLASNIQLENEEIAILGIINLEVV